LDITSSVDKWEMLEVWLGFIRPMTMEHSRGLVDTPWVWI